MTKILGVLAALVFVAAAAAEPVKVGSKRFTESYVLGEIVRQTLQAAGIEAQHRQGLGNTAILDSALSSGEVDLYPEYTGTIVRELLKRSDAVGTNPPLAQLNDWLAPRGLVAAVPLGFNNTYALGMREADAQRLGIDSISALARVAGTAGLRFGLSHEFLVRADGWPALGTAYGFARLAPRGLDHGIAYEALERGQVDVIDVYSTDAKIGRLKLRVLRDDRGFFPRYDAVLLMRAALDPKARAALEPLAGRLDEATMIALNAEVEIDGRSFAEVARGFVSRQGGNTAAAQASAGASPTPAPTPADRSFTARLFAPDLARLVGQHLLLVFGSLALAVVVGVPLGIWAFMRPRIAGAVMAVGGMLQTVPSLALLAFLIALVGTIGFWPALLALFVYALLPIVRNTHAGLQGVPAGLAQAGMALGLRDAQVLRAVQLPLALPTLLAGVKTAAVINVGTATVAAFIGAGGLGERIVAGLAVNDTTLMMAGAVPAAVLALVVQWGFDRAERRLQRVPDAA